MSQGGDVAELELHGRVSRALFAAAVVVLVAVAAWEGGRHVRAHSGVRPPADRDALLRAIRIDPGHAGLEHDLARLDLATLELEEAGRHYRESLRHNPGDARVWIEYAFVCESQGRLKEAAEAARKASWAAPGESRLITYAAEMAARAR